MPGKVLEFSHKNVHETSCNKLTEEIQLTPFYGRGNWNSDV